ncbi:MAG TPA: 5-amino-6-(D-ribitylamino)uracil--L-tyrosine 4-hydroxyphenyl transferase CofH [Acidimicrobiales bacterium]|nr:5-amino-6-(D-ribitylamino)uracil--L-tyrosine 4-hydroxyphenyl transferase CofH [Acidimicrobiales bacterium]
MTGAIRPRTWRDDELLRAPVAELVAAGGEARRSRFGRRVTYSPKVFVALTMLCRDRCGYCTFAKPPGRLAAPYLSPEEVVALAVAGRKAGCHEALFTLGESPEDRYRGARAWLAAHGYRSTVEYLAAAAALVGERAGLLVHCNAGALGADELALLRTVSVSQGMMLESLVPGLACHRLAPDKDPGSRLATLEAAGRLAIPFTTGVLVGIGETRRDRLDALRAIADAQRRYGHVQEVLVQGFLPKPGTAMRAAPPCPLDELRWTVAAARLILPGAVHVQSPPNLVDDPVVLVDAGADDLGGISPLTIDEVNPERAWPTLACLGEDLAAAGYELAPRLAVQPEYVAAPERWFAPPVRAAILEHCDAEGLARDSAWCAGSDVAPPVLVAPGRAPARGVGPRGPVDEVLAGVEAGRDPGVEEVVTLFSARGTEVRRIAAFADELRARAVGDTVTFVVNRNINYTNICTYKCRFCAFSKGPLSLNLRGQPYLLSLDEIASRVTEAEGAGATEVCLQGGIHPDFDGNYYLEVIRAVRAASDKIHIHGFTALEVTEGARRLGEPLESYLRRLYEAGLRSLPGTAAEILDDEIRAVLCPDKVTTAEWLEAHRTAHRVGLRSNVTIMFGSVESPLHWARHLLATRDLARETGGFTEFVPLPFVHMASPIYLAHHARRGPTFREVVLMHAIGRIVYDGVIDNVQASWVKTGPEGLRQLLQAGCNDVGGTLMDENISRAAGASHGQMMTPEAFRALVEPLGRRLEQRTTLYDRLKVPA